MTSILFEERTECCMHCILLDLCLWYEDGFQENPEADVKVTSEYSRDLRVRPRE